MTSQQLIISSNSIEPENNVTVVYKNGFPLKQTARKRTTAPIF